MILRMGCSRQPACTALSFMVPGTWGFCLLFICSYVRTGFTQVHAVVKKFAWCRGQLAVLSLARLEFWVPHVGNSRAFCPCERSNGGAHAHPAEVCCGCIGWGMKTCTVDPRGLKPPNASLLCSSPTLCLSVATYTPSPSTSYPLCPRPRSLLLSTLSKVLCTPSWLSPSGPRAEPLTSRSRERL